MCCRAEIEHARATLESHPNPKAAPRKREGRTVWLAELTPSMSVSSCFGGANELSLPSPDAPPPP